MRKRGLQVGVPTALPSPQQRLNVRRSERQTAQRRQRILRQQAYLHLQRPKQKRRGACVHVGFVMAQQQRQRPILGHHQRDGVVGLFASVQPAEAQPQAPGVAQHAVHRVVLEHDDIVEIALGITPTQAMNILQRHGLVLTRGQVLRLQCPQPVSHRHHRGHVDRHRQRVDEHADDTLRLRQLIRPAGHRGAKAHLVAAKAARQHACPCPLHERVERHMLRARPCREFPNPRGIDLKPLFALARGTGPRRQRARHPRGFANARGLTLPIALRRLPIVPAQPVDVVPILAGGRGDGLAAILAQHLAEQLRRAPAVHQQMVVRPQEMVPSVRPPNQPKAHERRRIQVKALRQFVPGQTRQRGLDIGSLAPVVPRERRRYRPRYPLQRRVARQEARAQSVVARQRGLPRLFETRLVKSCNVHPQLVDIGRTASFVGAVEQHPLLHGRQGIQVLHPLEGKRQRIQRVLIQACQREITGCDTPGAAHAVFDEAKQLLVQARHQGAHRGAILARRAIRKAQRQAAAQHLPTDSQFVLQRRGGVLACADRLGGRQPLRASLEGTVELAQVVKQDLRP
ncbi:hypothetical protein D3C85_455010 [compost metagenome]